MCINTPSKKIEQGCFKLRGIDRPSKIFTIKQLETIFNLKKEVLILRDLNYILNVILFNGAYSNKNLEQRIGVMKKINVPQWEQDMLTSATDVNSKIAHKIFSELQEFLSLWNNEYKIPSKNKSLDKQVLDTRKQLNDLIKKRSIDNAR